MSKNRLLEGPGRSYFAGHSSRWRMSGADPIAATLLGPDPNDSRVLGGTHALSSIHSTSRRRHCHDGWRPTLPHGEESVAGGGLVGSKCVGFSRCRGLLGVRKSREMMGGPLERSRRMGTERSKKRVRVEWRTSGLLDSEPGT